LLAFVTASIMPLWLGADWMSCDVGLVLNMLVVPLTMIPTLSRLLSFWNAHVFTQRIANMNVDEIVEQRNSKLKVTSTLGLVRKASKDAQAHLF